MRQVRIAKSAAYGSCAGRALLVLAIRVRWKSEQLAPSSHDRTEKTEVREIG